MGKLFPKLPTDEEIRCQFDLARQVALLEPEANVAARRYECAHWHYLSEVQRRHLAEQQLDRMEEALLPLLPMLALGDVVAAKFLKLRAFVEVEFGLREIGDEE